MPSGDISDEGLENVVRAAAFAADDEDDYECDEENDVYDATGNFDYV